MGTDTLQQRFFLNSQVTVETEKETKKAVDPTSWDGETLNSFEVKREQQDISILGETVGHGPTSNRLWILGVSTILRE